MSDFWSHTSVAEMKNSLPFVCLRFRICLQNIPVLPGPAGKLVWEEGWPGVPAHTEASDLHID